MPTNREFDIVLLGATGFTGGLTADYLARTMPADGRWALAGRNQGKLEAVRDRLTGIDAKLAGLPLLKADSSDPASLADIASRARVVITTVGPYVEHGEPLVAACAAHGTDYVDLTGEPEFIDRMYVDHHAEAERTGARIVHACGFDSIPHDLGALFTVKQLPEGVPLKVRGVVRSERHGLGWHVRLRADDVRARLEDARRLRRPAPGGAQACRWPPGALLGEAPALRQGSRHVAHPAADDRPVRRAPVGGGARALRPGLQLRPLRRREAAARGRRRDGCRRRADGRRAAAARCAGS